MLRRPSKHEHDHDDDHDDDDDDDHDHDHDEHDGTNHQSPPVHLGPSSPSPAAPIHGARNALANGGLSNTRRAHQTHDLSVHGACGFPVDPTPLGQQRAIPSGNSDVHG